jgi:radical SAM protein with 4Fe4S-binding SPASM domain
MSRNLNKPVNLLKAGSSYLVSSATGYSGIAGMPVSVSTELTNNCNLHCHQCPSGSGKMIRSKGFMDTELFKRVMNEMAPYLYNVNLYFQGEPMLHPQFFSFIENSKVSGITVSTNGHFLGRENAERLVKSELTRLIISLDGLDQETYSAYRVGGDMSRVIEGLKNVSAAKKRIKSALKIELQFLVNKYNEHQIQLVKKLAVDVNAALKLKSMQVIDNKDMASWLPEDESYSRYRKTKDYAIKSKLPDRCARLWFNPVITWDGKVVPCCFDKNAEFVMGDLNSETFAEIWNGPRYKLFRKQILTGRNSVEMCRNCTSGLSGVRV